jgi:hypothetical protein
MQTSGTALLAIERCSLVRVWRAAQGCCSAFRLLYFAAVRDDRYHLIRGVSRCSLACEAVDGLRYRFHHFSTFLAVSLSHTAKNPAARPASCSWITRLQTDVCHDAHMGYWQQFSLDLISPLVGSALVGGMAAIITRKYQDRRLDRQFRMGLVSRLTDIVYKIHTDLSFYERWVRHSKPTPEELDIRRQIVDEKFIAECINLGALQAEIDAYFGQNNTPGGRLHRLTDLIMLRYAVILDVPQSQLMELVEHLGQPGHSGYTCDQLYDLLKLPKPTGTTIWGPTKEIEAVFTAAFHDALSALLETWPLSKTKGFNSTKLLTDPDQRSALPNPQP